MSRATEIGITSLPNPTKNPIDLFKTIIDEMVAYKQSGLITMNLATANEIEGVLSRTLVYRGLTKEDAITFATDRNSRKFFDILRNPKVALTFLFELQVDGVNVFRQIRINGLAQELSQSAISKYWDADPLFAKVRSFVHLEKPKELDAVKLKYQTLMDDHATGRISVPIPETYTVLEVLPRNFEFYQSATNKVADCITYERQNDQWIMTRNYG